MDNLLNKLKAFFGEPSLNNLLIEGKAFWEHRRFDIILAVVLAAVFCVPAYFFGELILHHIKKAEIFIKLKKRIKKFNSRGNETYHNTEIANSIKSNYPKEAPEQFIVDAIEKHKVLTTNKRHHYESFDRIYHACRFLKFYPLSTVMRLFLKKSAKPWLLTVIL